MTSTVMTDPKVKFEAKDFFTFTEKKLEDKGIYLADDFSLKDLKLVPKPDSGDKQQYEVHVIVYDPSYSHDFTDGDTDIQKDMLFSKNEVFCFEEAFGVKEGSDDYDSLVDLIYNSSLQSDKTIFKALAAELVKVHAFQVHIMDLYSLENNDGVDATSLNLVDWLKYQQNIPLNKLSEDEKIDAVTKAFFKNSTAILLSNEFNCPFIDDLGIVNEEFHKVIEFASEYRLFNTDQYSVALKTCIEGYEWLFDSEVDRENIQSLTIFDPSSAMIKRMDELYDETRHGYITFNSINNRWDAFNYITSEERNFETSNEALCFLTNYTLDTLHYLYANGFKPSLKQRALSREGIRVAFADDYVNEYNIINTGKVMSHVVVTLSVEDDELILDDYEYNCSGFFDLKSALEY